MYQTNDEVGNFGVKLLETKELVAILDHCVANEASFSDEQRKELAAMAVKADKLGCGLARSYRIFDEEATFWFEQLKARFNALYEPVEPVEETAKGEEPIEV